MHLLIAIHCGKLPGKNYSMCLYCSHLAVYMLQSCYSLHTVCGRCFFCHPKILKLQQIIPDSHHSLILSLSAHSTGSKWLLHMHICSMNAHGSGQLTYVPSDLHKYTTELAFFPTLEISDQYNAYISRGKLAARWKSNM